MFDVSQMLVISLISDESDVSPTRSNIGFGTWNPFTPGSDLKKRKKIYSFNYLNFNSTFKIVNTLITAL